MSYVVTQRGNIYEAMLDTFRLVSGDVAIADPESPENEAMFIKNVRKGRWLPTICVVDGHVAEFIARYESEDCSNYEPVKVASVPVKNGLAGIFDAQLFLYRKANNEAPKNGEELARRKGKSVGYGAVTLAGYENGVYDVYARVSPTGEIVQINISYF